MRLSYALFATILVLGALADGENKENLDKDVAANSLEDAAFWEPELKHYDSYYPPGSKSTGGLKGSNVSKSSGGSKGSRGTGGSSTGYTWPSYRVHLALAQQHWRQQHWRLEGIQGLRRLKGSKGTGGSKGSKSSSEPSCPSHPPEPGEYCNVPPYAICIYGRECCCGKCSHSYECDCYNDEWSCFDTDFCLDPSCDDTKSSAKSGSKGSKFGYNGSKSGYSSSSESSCPSSYPVPGEYCNVSPYTTCSYGRECCCGKCSHSYECDCYNYEWGCFNTDFCLAPSCK